MRPGTARRHEAVTREFARFVLERDTAVVGAADIVRRHVEDYKSWLAERPAARGPKLHRHTIRERLGTLRNFFERIIEWGWDDAPARVPVFSGDLPIKDEALPRFLDDPAAAKLLPATPGRRRPVRPSGRRVPGPHRDAQGRVLGPHCRRRRADRLRVLAGPGLPRAYADTDAFIAALTHPAITRLRLSRPGRTPYPPETTSPTKQTSGPTRARSNPTVNAQPSARHQATTRASERPHKLRCNIGI